VEKYVRLSYVVIGLLVWAMLAAFLSSVLGWISPNIDKPLLGAKFAISDLLGLAAGVGAVVFLWFSAEVNKFGMEVAGELRSVTWPTWPETRVSTIVVVVTTVVVSLILGLFDAVIGALTSVIYRL
jgi:preprotein translocase subunit SecE